MARYRCTAPKVTKARECAINPAPMAIPASVTIHRTETNSM
ncbi:hypothetical protein [Paenibacillus sp. yr247]|nr:hypothetical protein [Paenibacillus sp. yr247]